VHRPKKYVVAIGRRAQESV